jgi:hypothetical protein
MREDDGRLIPARKLHKTWLRKNNGFVGKGIPSSFILRLDLYVNFNETTTLLQSSIGQKLASTSRG